MSLDPLSGTDLARIPLPDDVYGFGWAEVRTLIGRHATPSSAMTLVNLGFEEVPDGEVVTAAGASALLARGLMAPEGDRGVTRGEAAVLETLFARAVRWTAINFRNGDAGDLLITVEDGDIIAICQPRSYGTWFIALNNEVDRPEVVMARGVRAVTGLQKGTQFAFESRTLEHTLGTRFFAPDGDGWLVSDSAEGEQRRVADADIEAVIAEVVSGRAS